MKAVQMLATEPSFDANAVLVPAGHIGTFDADRLTGKEKHLFPVDKDFVPAVVEMAAISPTGPNPTAPQQIPPNAVQGPGGGYMIPGKRLVGEVTNPAEDRIDNANLRDADHEAANTEALAEVMDTPNPGAAATTAVAGAGTAGTENSDDALVDGTVAEVTANLGTKTDAELAQMRAAEVDREQPRKGVLKAIDAETEARKS